MVEELRDVSSWNIIQSSAIRAFASSRQIAEQVSHRDEKKRALSQVRLFLLSASAQDVGGALLTVMVNETHFEGHDFRFFEVKKDNDGWKSAHHFAFLLFPKRASMTEDVIAIDDGHRTLYRHLREALTRSFEAPAIDVFVFRYLDQGFRSCSGVFVVDRATRELVQVRNCTQ